MVIDDFVAQGGTLANLIGFVFAEGAQALEEYVFANRVVAIAGQAEMLTVPVTRAT